MKNIFDKIYLVGHGTPACLCGNILQEFNIPFTFLDCNENKYSFTKKRLQKIGIETKRLKSCVDILCNEIASILVLSVNNTYLFPSKILNKPNIIIINYHNSLLPYFRGMHAEAWAIFNGCQHTGITWHLVDEDIDRGEIIFQEDIKITDSMTSIALLQAQAYRAMSCFKQNIDKIFAGDLHLFANKHDKGSIYYKKDIPGGGILDLEWSNEKIWCFLRAMDYGPYYNLGYPLIKLGDRKYSWKKYSRKDWKDKKAGINFKSNIIAINDSIYLEDVFEVF